MSALQRQHAPLIRDRLQFPTPAILLLILAIAVAPAVAGGRGASAAPPGGRSLTAEERVFLEDLSHRAFLFFLEQADPGTGLVRDRSRNTGVIESERDRDVASIAATGFGLTALCIGAEHGWIQRAEARRSVVTTLRFFAERAPSEHGWFYHFMAAGTGGRKWNSELSSIDTSLLLAGILTARQYFADDREITTLADAIYGRVDFQWMLNGDKHLLAMGWSPEKGFIASRWDHYCEHNILYLLAIASAEHGIPSDSWYAWKRPTITYGKYRYIYGDYPLFAHQYAHAWIDFRNRRETREPHIDWFENSVKATLAHREYCRRLSSRFPGYSVDIWGITASDSANGYVAWGGPPDDPRVDGTVVPCAAAGSLMFTPRESLSALRKIKELYGGKTYGRYGFSDSFNPNTGWVNADVIGIDVGITILSAENLTTGNVWKWFMASPGTRATLDRIGLKLR